MKIIERASGLIEIQCSHGVGHPSQVLTEASGRRYREADDIHGCCEGQCCSTAKFQKRERQLAGEAKRLGRGE